MTTNVAGSGPSSQMQGGGPASFNTNSDSSKVYFPAPDGTKSKKKSGTRSKPLKRLRGPSKQGERVGKGEAETRDNGKQASYTESKLYFPNPSSDTRPIISYAPTFIDWQGWRLTLEKEKSQGLVSEAPPKSEAAPNSGAWFFHSPPDVRLEIGEGFYLVPRDLREAKKEGLSGHDRLYNAHHITQSEAFAVVGSHPSNGAKNTCTVISTKVGTTERQQALLADLVDAIGFKSIQLRKRGLELKTVGTDFPDLYKWLKENGAVRKNSRVGKYGQPTVQIGKITQVSNAGFQIDTNGPAESLLSGSVNSEVRATGYHFGKTLKQRNKEHQGHFAIANGLIKSHYEFKQLHAIETRPKKSLIDRLKVVGDNGTKRPIQHPRDLVDGQVVADLFRATAEQTLTFYLPNEGTGKRRKFFSFFDWQAIGAAKLEKMPRRSNSRYSAKQLVKRLLLDSRPGDYLVQVLDKKLKKLLKTCLENTDILKVLIDTLTYSTTAAAEQVSQIVTGWSSMLTGSLGTAAAKHLPDLIARIVAKENDVGRFYNKSQLSLSKLPPIERPLSTLKLAA